MRAETDPVRVLYSFPHKLGADRICYTAWQQVNGLAAAGVEVLAFPGAVHRPVPEPVRVKPTLARGKLRVPYRVLGKMRALWLHDRIVARRLPALVGRIDIVHAWPAAALETLRVCRELGIPTVLERPNAHTRFAFDIVGKESARLGIVLPKTDEYFYRQDLLDREEEEYRRADYLLCPSEFVARTFRDQGVPREKLLRHSYGFDEKRYIPEDRPRERGLTMLFAGVCAVRKGVHFALEAWLQSLASQEGTFLIAGEFLPAYAEKLAPMLAHPSVKMLGYRSDVPDLMRKSDLLVLPSLEEGFPLVVAEGLGSGCVPLVSNACSEICEYMGLESQLVHPVGDVQTLATQITRLHEDRGLLERLRTTLIHRQAEFTWATAGIRLQQAYRQAINGYQTRENTEAHLPLAK